MNQEQRITAMASLMVQARKKQKDIGAIIAASLAQAARQLGDSEKLVAGRPGSWEAEIVRRMARAGTVNSTIKHEVERLAPLFVEMGKAQEDGGDVLSRAMSKAVNALGGLDAFAGTSSWYWDLTNMGRQYSNYLDE